jgi:hypothetical protein
VAVPELALKPVANLAFDMGDNAVDLSVAAIRSIMLTKNSRSGSIRATSSAKSCPSLSAKGSVAETTMIAASMSGSMSWLSRIRAVGSFNPGVSTS